MATRRLGWSALVIMAMLAGGSLAAAEPAATAVPDHLDARHGHGHRYPDAGAIVTALPHGAYRVPFAGDKYWFQGGAWYRANGTAYVVVVPPAGIVTPVLPPYFTTVNIGGVRYYYANDTYYLYSEREGGFRVVVPPPQPPAPPALAAAGPLYAYPMHGQSAAQQAQDRAECHRWAVEQSGFDPAGTDRGGDAAGAHPADYLRAMGACFDGRGYTAR